MTQRTGFANVYYTCLHPAPSAPLLCAGALRADSPTPFHSIGHRRRHVCIGHRRRHVCIGHRRRHVCIGHRRHHVCIGHRRRHVHTCRDGADAPTDRLDESFLMAHGMNGSTHVYYTCPDTCLHTCLHTDPLHMPTHMPTHRSITYAYTRAYTHVYYTCLHTCLHTCLQKCLLHKVLTW